MRCTSWMQFPGALRHSRSKTKPPDPVLGIGRSPKKYTFSGSSLLSKHGRPRRLHPNPQSRSILGASPQQPWVISPVGFRGRSYTDSVCLCETNRKSVESADASLSKGRRTGSQRESHCRLAQCCVDGWTKHQCAFRLVSAAPARLERLAEQLEDCRRGIRYPLAGFG